MAPTLYVAITNHGFGHATRAAAVVATVQQRCPDVRLIVTTTAPEWLLKGYISGPFVHRQRAFDVGVLQQDSLIMDKAATLEKLQRIQATAAELVASEAAFLRAEGVDLVLADIPPLATPIAEAAGVPCWMMSNFGWDFIYGAWGPDFAEVTEWIRDCFKRCDRIFRLPFHESMNAFSHIIDVGLTGGDPRLDLAALRTQFNLTAPVERTVLLSFGGLGLQQIPYAGLAQFPDWQFITLDHQAPELPNLRKVIDRGYRPVDFMPLCSRVVSKPGYSTFSEACRQDLPVVTITREDFAEAPVLIEGLTAVAQHQILAPEEFFGGSWEFLRQPFVPPRRPGSVGKDGNGEIADAILEYLGN